LEAGSPIEEPETPPLKVRDAPVVESTTDPATPDFLLLVPKFNEFCSVSVIGTIIVAPADAFTVDKVCALLFPVKPIVTVTIISANRFFMIITFRLIVL
jgi:hypothetical protein